MKKVLGTDKYHWFVDKRNSIVFVVFSTIRLLQRMIFQKKSILLCLKHTYIMWFSYTGYII